MCGIAGFIARGREGRIASLAETVTKTMVDALQHRGPDGSGSFADAGIALGHARLSIIDLRGGDQPLYNEDGSIALVVNGEIYDYKALRAELAKRHELATRSDSEVMLHLWEECGAKFRSRINGMYAYALYSRVDDQLEIGLDPVGIKPLYWYADSYVFLFASEMRAIVAGLRRAGRPLQSNDRQIQSFLMQGWIPSDETGIKGVRRVLPGETIRITRELERTHTVDQDSLRPEEGEKQQAAMQADIEAAIRRQLVADVPVGVFLSGGIDSSLVTAVASKHVDRLKTYTVRFTGGSEASRVNEADVALRIAQRFGCDHHELSVTETTLLGLLDVAFEAQDDLIADPAVLPLLELSRLAAQSVKVCLSGDGGDELFGGYLRHQWWWTRRLLQRSPGVITTAANHIRRLLPERGGGIADPLRRARLLLNVLLDPNYTSGPFAGDMATLLNDHGARMYDRQPMSAHEIIAAEIEGPLSTHMLVKTDRISMWNSLEVRVPLLDQNVVKAAEAVPWKSKSGVRMGKQMLRNIAASYIPADIAGLRKRGFRVPIADWFRHGLYTSVQERLLDGAADLEPYITPAIITQLLAEHKSNLRDHSMRIWSLLVLQNWQSRYL